MLLTFNPVSATHWLKKRFFDNRDPKALVHESTYKDNRFLIQEEIDVLESFKDTDPYYYQVYCLGQWGITGKTVFQAQRLSERLEELRKKKKTRGSFVIDTDENGKIRSWRWQEEENGDITIYQGPESGRPYVIGGDEALGIVEEYAARHRAPGMEMMEFEVYIVWKCKVLQNWKYLISTTLPDGMYYEMTYNGDKKEWYLDAYQKFENVRIPG